MERQGYIHNSGGEISLAKYPYGSVRKRFENDIKMDLRKAGCENGR
jgi:hypothetical protein